MSEQNTQNGSPSAVPPPLVQAPDGSSAAPEDKVNALTSELEELMNQFIEDEGGRDAAVCWL